MNANELFEDNIFGNGNPTYYLDEKCNQPYTGHVEIYYNNIISEEFDVVNGVRHGIEKIYENGCISIVSQTINNRESGFGVDYYPTGIISAIGITYRDIMLIGYFYNENGKLKKKCDYWDRYFPLLEKDPEDILKLVSVSELEKMNEEILTYGHPLNLPKGFEFVSLNE